MHSIKCLILAREPQDWAGLESHMKDIPGAILEKRASQLEAVLEGSLADTDLIFCEYGFVEPLTTYSYIYNVKVPPVVCLLSENDRLEELGANRVFGFLTKTATQEQVIETIRQAVRNKYSPKEGGYNRWKRDGFIFINSEYKIIRIKFEDIQFCEGMKDYTQIYLAAKAQPVITLQNLKTFSSKLPDDVFVRVHRSFVVSLHHLETISRNEITIGKKIIPIGNSYRNDFFHIVESNS
jgi:DNA-binding LytR/AlgR family response regulator